MRGSPARPGSALQTLLYIVLLCGVIALVPALASGVKHASGAMLRAFSAGDRSAGLRAMTGDETQPRAARGWVVTPVVAVPGEACPGGMRFCRV